MSLNDRGHLQSLISYLGMSQREAAAFVGISEEALSRKLAGKERYDIREGEVAALEQLADLIDQMVERGIEQIRALIKGGPPEREWGMFEPVRLLVYRRDEDMAPWTGLPFASVHRAAMARVERGLRRPKSGPLDDAPGKGRAYLVMFDPESYKRFSEGRQDTQELRSEWAAMQPMSRLGLKLDNTKLGWAVIREVDEPAIARKRGGVKQLR